APRLSMDLQNSTTPFMMNAYPNPFKGYFTLEFVTPADGDARIDITDVTGRVVESFMHSAGTMNIGKNLKSGIYFISLNQDGFKQVMKVIKQE
ncbi:MAG: T9SS type A sorting domain-containing protein, partial [Flavobacterium sp.]